MIKIMFVCHGNICRSPMAEFILKKMLKEKGLENQVYVSSSATSTEEIWQGRGNPVYPPAKRELASHGISCEGKTAVLVKKSDYPDYDMFICMDSNNVRNLMRILGSDPQKKVSKLNDDDVSDPWYSGDFSKAYNDIYEGCQKLIEKLEFISK